MLFVKLDDGVHRMSRSVGIAGECISAMASVCLASEEPGLQAEAAWLCASIAAMPHK